MTPLTERQKEIVVTSGRLISQSGISSLTIKNIAREMGFTESAVYRHFSSKDQIVLSMLYHLMAEMEVRDAEILAKYAPALEKIAQIFLEQLGYFQNNPHFTGVVFPDGLLDESSEINAAILQMMATKKKYLVPLITEGQFQKQLRDDITCEEIAHILMGSFRLLVLNWRISKYSFDLQLQGQQLLSTLFKLITI